MEGNIQWGENASTAIQRLQEAKLPASEIANIGILLQAAIHAAEIYWRPGDVSTSRREGQRQGKK